MTKRLMSSQTRAWSGRSAEALGCTTGSHNCTYSTLVLGKPRLRHCSQVHLHAATELHRIDAPTHATSPSHAHPVPLLGPTLQCPQGIASSPPKESLPMPVTTGRAASLGQQEVGLNRIFPSAAAGPAASHAAPPAASQAAAASIGQQQRPRSEGPDGLTNLIARCGSGFSVTRGSAQASELVLDIIRALFNCWSCVWG